MSIESTIRDIQEAITEHQAIYRSNEMAVRDNLINPILNELGWNTRSLRFVIPNAPNDDGRIPDYTLMKEGRKMLIIEAKNMSIELSDLRIINQLVAYCYTPGIRFGIITNGVQWLLFSTFQPNPSERIVWRLDLLKDSIEDTIKKLTCISYQNIEQIEQMSSLIYNDEIMKNTWKKLINDKNCVVDSLFIMFQQKVKNDYPSLVINLEKTKVFIMNDLINIFKDQPIVPPPPPPPPLTDRIKVRVTFPDRISIFHNNVTSTFSEVIEKIGIERVKQLNIMRFGINLISENKHSKYHQHKVSENCFIMVSFSTRDKIRILDEINQRLNVQMTIETLDSTA